MIYKNSQGELLCFRHAVLRVMLRGEDIREESSMSYRSGCFDCIADKEASNKHSEEIARRKLM